MNINAERSFDLTYQIIHNAEPPATIRHEESNADILSASRGFMCGFDWTMQLQVGCPGGCLFCYVPNGPRLTPKDVRGPGGSQWGFVVRDKLDAAGKLSRHLNKGDLADKTLYWSGVTDPYASPPTVSRDIWRVLCDVPAHIRPRRIAIQSRFRADRDVELMAEYEESYQPSDRGPAIVISFSIGTDRNDQIRSWERATPLFEQRVQTVCNLRQHGLCVVVTLSPFGLWHDLSGTLSRFKNMGVAYITVLFLKKGHAVSQHASQVH
ncbi:MAG: hypothetical protein IPK83_22200 [Planctomycetes bacterium]|nr:hypothetical protein [Planctomycetota bacterium]